jgi:hypothetical protein
MGRGGDDPLPGFYLSCSGTGATVFPLGSKPHAYLTVRIENNQNLALHRGLQACYSCEASPRATCIAYRDYENSAATGDPGSWVGSSLECHCDQLVVDCWCRQGPSCTGLFYIHSHLPLIEQFELFHQAAVNVARSRTWVYCVGVQFNK